MAHKQLEQCKQEKEEEKKKLEKLQTEMAVKSAQVCMYDALRSHGLHAYVHHGAFMREFTRKIT